MDSDTGMAQINLSGVMPCDACIILSCTTEFGLLGSTG